MASATEKIIPSSVATEIFVVQVVMLAIAILSYLIRMIFKYRRYDNFGIDDIFVTLAVICFATVEALLWRSKAPATNIAAADGIADGVLLSRTGLYMVLYWTITGTSQLSIFWFYRYVCSGFSWAKAFLTFGIVLTFSGWAAFTVCDSINLAFTKANAKPSSTTLLLEGYDSFETASMILEPLCSFLILCIQMFRLNHIRSKIISKPYLLVVPLVTIMVVVTGILRLVYFRQHDMVSEMIWLQVHLGTSILCASVPVYTGLEKLCCMSQERPSEVELWLRAVQAQPPAETTPRASKDTDDMKEIDIESFPSCSRPPTRRPSESSTWVPASSRRPSDVSSWHGVTREIVFEPEEFNVQRDGASCVPARRPSKVEKATKRLILEG